MKKIFPSLLIPLLSACATEQLSENGDKVELVDSLSPSDLLAYERVASLHSTAMQTQGDCRNDLRNKAAAQGATILRLMPAEPDYCLFDGFKDKAEKKCFKMDGYAYRPKAAPTPGK